MFTPIEQDEHGDWFGVLPVVEGGERSRFPLAPFLGIMGVAVDGDERPHSVPPGSHGGNIDIRLLTPGRRSTCRCKCRARWRTSATRTSRRATARCR